MASLDISNVYNFTDKRKGTGTTVDPAAALVTTLSTVALMRTRLTAINAATYTTDVLNHMTDQDMRYAIRLNDDPTSGVNG